jgi:hypothetical protein
MVNELHEVHWLVCEDFNMVDSQDDKEGFPME